MYSDFAYSHSMQLILMFFAYTYNFIILYGISNIILKAHDEKATVQQKALFAFLTGCVMYTGFSYLVYFIGDMISFSHTKYLLVVSPNPIMALIYCLLGIKILRLSYVRSIELMGDIYLYHAIINSIIRLIGASFFVQNATKYNFLMDFTHLAICLIIFISIYYGTCIILHKKPNLFAAKTQILVNPQKDLMIFILKASIIYITVACLPLVISNQIVAHIMVNIILVLVLICSLLNNNYQYLKVKVHNNELHIDSLLRASDEFRAIKHDFYNILQTYNGYFEIGNYEDCKKYHDSLVKITLRAGESLELNHHLKEHPALVSLLIQKRDRASQLGFDMEISLKCTLSDLPLNEIDLCRLVSCLLDNAIEAANESEQKHLSFVMKSKTSATRLIIITNSTNNPLPISEIFTAGVTTKPDHQGIGLSNVRNIINKYGNCSFQMNLLNHEMVAYIELGQE